MTYSQRYGGLIWTDHAVERMRQRKFEQRLAVQAYKHPDEVLPGKQSGTKEYQKRYKQSLITLICARNTRGETVVISCWIDPPLPGTSDARKKKQWKRYKNAGVLGKIWMQVLKQFGLTDW